MTRVALLDRINKIQPEAVLRQEIVPGISELQIAQDAIERARILRTTNGIIELPGLTIWRDTVLKAIADFKENVANSQPLNFASRVTANDIGVESLDRPQVWSGLTSFRQTGLTQGQLLPVLRQGAANSGAAVNLLANKERYIITDVVEFDPAAGVESIRITPDGDNNIQAQAIGKDMRSEGGVRIAPLDFPIIVDSSIKIEARLNQGTTDELVPLGIRVFVGTEARAL